MNVRVVSFGSTGAEGAQALLAGLMQGDNTANETRELAEKACAEGPESLNKPRGLTGNTVLIEVVGCLGDVALARRMIECGADKDAKSYTQCTAINMASRMGSEDMVSLILDQGADVRIRTNEGWTCLHGAVASMRLPVVRLLLRRCRPEDLGVDAKTIKGETALHRACRMGQTAIVEALLMEGGAKHLIEDGSGLAAKEIAILKGHRECAALLERYEVEMVERPLLLHKARCLQDVQFERGRLPEAPLPAYLQDRSSSLPAVEVEPPQTKDSKEEEQCEVLKFVVQEMNREVYKELLDGLRPRTTASTTT